MAKVLTLLLISLWEFANILLNIREWERNHLYWSLCQDIDSMYKCNNKKRVAFGLSVWFYHLGVDWSCFTIDLAIESDSNWEYRLKNGSPTLPLSQASKPVASVNFEIPRRFVSNRRHNRQPCHFSSNMFLGNTKTPWVSQAPGWPSGLSIWLLILAQVMISQLVSSSPASSSVLIAWSLLGIHSLPLSAPPCSCSIKINK